MEGENGGEERDGKRKTNDRKESGDKKGWVAVRGIIVGRYTLGADQMSEKSLEDV